jgi:hypothetical protein
MLRSMSVRITPRQHDAVLVKTKDVAIREGGVDARTHGRLPALRAVERKKNFHLKKGLAATFAPRDTVTLAWFGPRVKRSQPTPTARKAASVRLDTVSTKRFTKSPRFFHSVPRTTRNARKTAI